MGYAKSSLYIMERFSVGIHKSTPIYMFVSGNTCVGVRKIHNGEI